MSSKPDDPTWTTSQAEQAIRVAFPTLDVGAVRHLGRGWDADVFTDEVWTFRFARNAFAAQSMAREPRMLAWLGPKLPLPAPVPVQSRVDPERDAALIVARFLPGRSICDAQLGREERATLAKPLAAFVRALHAVEPHSAPVPLGHAIFHRFDAEARTPVALERLHAFKAGGTLAPALVSRLTQLLEDGLPARVDTTDHVVHADIHVRNLLVHDGTPSGVIDWIDLHQGETAIDLASAFMILPVEAHDTFLQAYGDVHAFTYGRARWRALVHALGTLVGALERGDHEFALATRTVLAELGEG